MQCNRHNHTSEPHTTHSTTAAGRIEIEAHTDTTPHTHAQGKAAARNDDVCFEYE